MDQHKFNVSMEFLKAPELIAWTHQANAAHAESGEVIVKTLLGSSVETAVKFTSYNIVLYAYFVGLAGFKFLYYAALYLPTWRSGPPPPPTFFF